MRSSSWSTGGRVIPALSIALLCGMLVHPSKVHADDENRNSDEARIRRGREGRRKFPRPWTS
jgi:hypothetical protein